MEALADLDRVLGEQLEQLFVLRRVMVDEVGVLDRDGHVGLLERELLVRQVVDDFLLVLLHLKELLAVAALLLLAFLGELNAQLLLDELEILLCEKRQVIDAVLVIILLRQLAFDDLLNELLPTAAYGQLQARVFLWLGTVQIEEAFLVRLLRVDGPWNRIPYAVGLELINLF